MYLSIDVVLESIRALARVHPFHGITYLACKKHRLPVSDNPEMFRLDASTKEHMDTFHRICPPSNRYYQPFGSLSPDRRWVNPDYPSSGLQRINTSTFRSAFRHEPGQPHWSWSESYVDVLASNLYRNARIPALHLSVWLYRQRDFGTVFEPDDLVARFFSDYGITEEEINRLFDTEIVGDTSRILGTLPAPAPVGWIDLRQEISYPPDVVREGGDVLQSLEVSGCGPVDRFHFQPARHLTLVTGDNGLGKTFLLECCWFVLTGSWAGTPIVPRPDAGRSDVWLRYAVGGKGEYTPVNEVRFDWNTLDWHRNVPKRRVETGLILYARVDGSFSVWDPIKALDQHSRWAVRNPTYGSEEVWNGRPGAMEGIVRDWSRWQNNPNPESFQKFVEILHELSPPDLGILVPGELTRVYGDPREIPTIRHRYGEVPILFASAGVKRIIAIAYLMVWAWQEHQVAAGLTKARTEQRMVVLIDEVEAHLHPRWQRQVLGALTSTVGRLSPDIGVQVIVTTHSPLILAAAEPVFDADRDSLVHLRLADEGSVTLDEVPFSKQGDAAHWLTSSAFELRHARSRDAETAIEAAKSLQMRTEASPADVQRVDEELRRVLGPDDQFWLRWLAFAQDAGIEL